MTFWTPIKPANYINWVSRMNIIRKTLHVFEFLFAASYILLIGEKRGGGGGGGGNKSYDFHPVISTVHAISQPCTRVRQPSLLNHSKNMPDFWPHQETDQRGAVGSKFHLYPFAPTLLAHSCFLAYFVTSRFEL
jgi:hypothetical protein